MELELVDYLALVRGYGGDYETFAVFSPNDILPILNESRKLKESGTPVHKLKVELGGRQVEVYTPRILTYTKGQSCVFCDLVDIEVFAVQKSGYGVHMNAFGRHKITGRMLMITSDHIIPKARGGNDTLENRQPACEVCNVKKGDTLPEEYESPRMSIDRVIIRRGRHVRPERILFKRMELLITRLRNEYNSTYRFSAWLGQEEGIQLDNYDLDRAIQKVLGPNHKLPAGLSTMLTWPDLWKVMSENEFQIVRKAIKIVRHIMPELHRYKMMGLSYGL